VIVAIMMTTMMMIIIICWRHSTMVLYKSVYYDCYYYAKT